MVNFKIILKAINGPVNSSISLILVCLAITLIGCSKDSPKAPAPQINNALDSLLTPISIIEAAFINHDSDIIVTVKGSVTSVLSDDTVGDNHQRFIIQLSNQQTLLIAHNIDIAPRVAGIAVGAILYIHGDYVWNDQGGLIHWTHHDPDGIHENGWIILGDVKYQ